MGRPGQPLPRRAGRPVRGAGGPRTPEIADAASRQAAKLGYFPCGPMPTRPPSSWRTASPTWRRATSTACSSPPAAVKRWSRRGSWAPVLRHDRPARAREGDQPPDRVPRHHARGAQHHRPRRHQAALPPAAERSGAPCAEHPDGPARQPRRCAGRCRRHRSDDRRGGSRDRRRTSSRCRTRRLPRSPAGLLPTGARDLRPPRCAVRERRGHLRAWSARRLVRVIASGTSPT